MKYINSSIYSTRINSTSALLPLLIEENEYIESIREFLVPVIQNPQVMKINNFGKKYKSYANAVKKNN